MAKYQHGNVTLHYELAGSGPPAVYISGFGCHSNDFIGMVIRQALCPQYQVLAVDNRGAGQTVVGQGESVTLEDMTDDIAAIMDHHGIRQAQVLGISMGGAIAMMLALRHPEKVKSMIVAVSLAWSPTPSRGIYMLTTTRKMRDSGIPRELISRYTAVFLLSENLFQNEGFMQAWENSPLDPFQQTAEGFEQQKAAITRYDLRDQLHHILVPTLVMSSPDDLLVPPRFQDEIADSIPNTEIKRYPGGHAFMVLPMYSQSFSKMCWNSGTDNLGEQVTFAVTQVQLSDRKFGLSHRAEHCGFDFRTIPIVGLLLSVGHPDDFHQQDVL